MDFERLLELLEQVRRQKITVAQAVSRLQHLPFEDLGFARVDHHRTLRQGFPEVIFGEGKKPEQVAAIVRSLLPHKTNILITRCSRPIYARVRRVTTKAHYHESALAASVAQDGRIYGEGIVHVVCAGTSDIPVAEEAALTARLM